MVVRWNVRRLLLLLQLLKPKKNPSGEKQENSPWFRRTVSFAFAGSAASILLDKCFFEVDRSRTNQEGIKNYEYCRRKT